MRRNIGGTDNHLRRPSIAGAIVSFVSICVLIFIAIITDYSRNAGIIIGFYSMAFLALVIMLVFNVKGLIKWYRFKSTIEESREGYVRCPYCRNFVNENAVVCNHCDSKLR